MSKHRTKAGGYVRSLNAKHPSPTEKTKNTTEAQAINTPAIAQANYGKTPAADALPKYSYSMLQHSFRNKKFLYYFSRERYVQAQKIRNPFLEASSSRLVQ